MKALITGISGFVGPYLKRKLESEGISVVGLDRSSQDNPIDLLDHKKVFRFISKEKPDFIFHLAGFSSVSESFKKPDLCFKVNVEGTKNLLDAVVESGLSPKILIVSSAEVYGKPEYLPIDEKHPLNGKSPYAKSRIEQEKLALSYDLHIVISRSFNHTGPGQQEWFVCSAFAKKISEIEKRSGNSTIQVGNLEAIRDFSDVRDIVEGYYMMLIRGKPKNVYNIGSGKGYKIKQILNRLIELINIEVNVKADPEKMRPSDIPKLVCDYSKLKKDTGWSPKIDLNDTLRQMLEWWKKEIS